MQLTQAKPHLMQLRAMVQTLVFVVLGQLLCGHASAAAVNQLVRGNPVQGVLDFAGRQYVLPGGRWITAHRESRVGGRGGAGDGATVVLVQMRDNQLTALVRLVVEYPLVEQNTADRSLCDAVRNGTTFQEKTSISVSTIECLRTSAFNGSPDEYVRGPWGHVKAWLQDNKVALPELGMVAEYDFRSLNESIEYTVWQPLWDNATRVSDDKQAAFKAWALQFRQVQREHTLGEVSTKIDATTTIGANK